VHPDYIVLKISGERKQNLHPTLLLSQALYIYIYIYIYNNNNNNNIT